MAGVSLMSLFPASPLPIDDSHEIGALPAERSSSAMLVGRNNIYEEPLIYSGEIPIYASMVWRILERDGGPPMMWWRLEVQVERGNTLIKPDDQLIVAEHPYANGWVQYAPFKRSCKKGGDERTTLPIDTWQTPITILDWIERQPHDFWERGDYLTAGISQPAMPFITGKGVRKSQRKALLVFGVCSDFDESVKDLWSTPAVVQMLELTERKKIGFGYPEARAEVRFFLADEVVQERESLMLLSIRQALAGPHKNSDTWIGRPVVENVAWIYQEHLNRRNRQVVRKQKREYGCQREVGRDMERRLREQMHRREG